MEQIGSPDQPAYLCYAIVALVGLWVAYARVNKLMGSSPGRWGFFQTWLVFMAYAVVPIILFWLLDFTNALHDTSLFAALLVAVSYRQILAGETKGLSVPGQFSSLWSPFETWANVVRDRIGTKSKRASDRLYSKLQDYLAADSVRAANLRALAYSLAEDEPELTKDLTAIAAQAQPPGVEQAAFDRILSRRAVARCLQSIRTVNPEDYGDVLHGEKLINSGQWFILRGFLAHVWLVYGLAFIAMIFSTFGLIFFDAPTLDKYHLWRFQKANATERDRFRTHEYLLARVSDQAASARNGFFVIEPLVRLLRFRDIDRKVAENIISLVLEFRDLGLTRHAVPVLIEVLRTENPDVRLRVHQALKDLQSLAYPDAKLDQDLEAWVPSKSESAGDVEKRIKKYYEWWSTIPPEQSSPAESPAPPAAPSATASPTASP
ncbi:MAG TPA: hypothetical protein VGW57_10240 [Chthoniobacterales bacterium]|nr:hypothetical protein [Chthoniobacterales bacterium]